MPRSTTPTRPVRVSDARRDLRLARRQSRERFLRARRAEGAFVRQLRSIGKQVGAVVRAYAPAGVVEDLTGLRAVLERYAGMLRPWATAVVQRMQAEVAVRDEKAWMELGRSMGREMAREIRFAPTGAALKQRMAEQVELISSLPLEAARRVHRLTIAAVPDSTRAEEIKNEIARSGKVTESRAMLIARTEIARTQSVLTEVRARHVGSDGYIWRTVLDSDVRKSHKEMEGKFVAWDEPPTLSDGTTTHAGQIYNCRCWAEPVIPDRV